uniref:PB1-like domain-containing protein n=1 Tax=Lactuca sativa TaxID=4236 RepID=A0A9R1US14_LACSA|nr:hypothetical protein LSAT_V11C800424930 [Lactuca sativa]
MEENQAFPKVDVHYNGTFVPNSLVYFAPQVLRLNEDANEFGFSDFIKYVEKFIDFQCKHVYYYIPEVRLSEGLQTLQNECDYSEFLEVANANRHVDVYIDHDNEPRFEWIRKEEPDNEELMMRTVNMKRINVLHQAKESSKEPIMIIVVEDEDEKGNELLAVYPRHDDT